tara:strand:+ start:1292 stop:1894 length:603 start_codon:yes stop_codon:yes gene_type:complete
MNNKDKIRSNYEIKQRKKAFLEVTNLFKKNHIDFFLYGGVLLGFHRDKNFIKWDWDVEIGMFEKDLDLNYEKILRILKFNNFLIISKNKDELKIVFTKYSKPSITQFEINGFVYDYINKNFIRKKLNIPSKFLRNLSQIKIFNQKYFTPSPRSDFLKYVYDDWKKKINTTKKEIYLSKKMLNDNNWKFYLKLRKIKRILF